MELKKYREFIPYVFYAITIFLFIPFIINVIFGFVAMQVSEIMTPSLYFLFIGEMFVMNWYFHIPAIVLLLIGIFLSKRKN